MNPKVTTCGAICTAARNNGLTLKEQIKFETKTKFAPEDSYCRGCHMLTSQCECWDAINQI